MVEKKSKKTPPSPQKKGAAPGKKAAPVKKARVIPDTTGNNALRAIKAKRRKGNLTAAMLRLMGPLLEGIVRHAMLNMGAAKTAKLIHFENSLPASGGAHSLERLRIEAAKKTPKPKKAPKPKEDAPPSDEQLVAAAMGEAAAEAVQEPIDTGAPAVEVTAN